MNGMKNGVLLAGLSVLACSGRYEVGGLDDVGGSAGTGTSMSAGGTSAGGSSSTGGSDPPYASPATPGCVPPGQPPALSGEFVTPLKVWGRVAPFIWGEEPPRSALPASTTYEWAGDLVSNSFAELESLSEAEGGNRTPGGPWFVRRWLHLTDEDPLLGDYDVGMLREDVSVLDVLLLSSWAPGHSGVFSEKAWLASRPSIPQRGSAMAYLLFAAMVPAPPPGVVLTVDPTLSDREAIMEATSQSPSCAACHNMFNGLGFALGNFDHMGNYRMLDHGKPIDTSGHFPGSTRTFEFDGIADLGMQAASSCEAARGLVRSFLEVAVTELDYDQSSMTNGVEPYVDRVTQVFIADGRSYRALVRAYAQSPLVLY